MLQGYLDGEVDPPTATAVGEHLEACRRRGLEASTYHAIQAATAAGSGICLGKTQIDPASLARLDDFARALAEGQAPEDA